MQKLIIRYLIIFVLIVSGLLLTTEFLLRVIFAFKVGHHILYYGTPLYRRYAHVKPDGANHTVMWHENTQNGYSKYFPYQTLKDYDETGQVFKVKINKYGFRGKDFEIEKPSDVLRIVTLGASSTFGYHCRYKDTYPYILEELLKTKLQIFFKKSKKIKKVEVINLGIPHLRTDNILALFVNEALRLQPDIVTFYEGINDCGRTIRAVSTKRTRKSSSMFFKKLRFYLKRVYYSLKGVSVLISLLDSLRKSKLVQYSEEDFKQRAKYVKKIFFKNLKKIIEVCKKNNIKFVLINQQVKSCFVPKSKLKGVSYIEEVNVVTEELTHRSLNGVELHFLIHSELMKNEKEFASLNNVYFVDAIAALDKHRDYLVTSVHLNEKGNRILAHVIADKIVEIVYKHYK